MKISLKWLGDYIEFIENDPQKIADAITAHTAEVDEIEVQGSLLEHCCVGKVLSVSKHPNADKLQLCEVLTDKGSKNVVCGGTNLREGMRVAFAHIGATVKWHGEDLATLEPVKIRGEQSEGMICAAEELDIDALFPQCTGTNIVDMGDGEDDVGKPLRDVLHLNDTILHIDNHAITHRADLFSHVGFAVECVAMGIAKWKKAPEYKAPDFPSTDLPFTFRVTAKDAIPRYCSCLLEIDSLGETPAFMKERLASVGIRSISLPIDITNFVMMEMGVPMHSFDADDIKGDFVARLAKKGEPLKTLDEKEWELPENALVFTDDEGNFDLVGIMGGLRSSTKESTKRIYLHALSIDPVLIRNAVIATGHRTDAATIYEKKVAHVSVELGFYRALELFLEHVPGAKIVSKPEVFGDNGEAKAISLDVARTKSLLGEDIPAQTMRDILERLGCSVEGDDQTLSVTPPLHRLGDLEESHDLVEEVGRMYGYNTIQTLLPNASIAPPVRDQRVNLMRDHLKAVEYIELLPLCLVGPDLLNRVNISAEHCTKIENALGAETSIMAPSTLPALLEHAEKNLLQFDTLLRTFHISNVFDSKGEEQKHLGALLTTKGKTDLLSDPFLLLKQELTEALCAAGYHLTLDVCDAPPAYASKGRCALLRINNEDVGTLFEVHPEVRSRFDLPSRAVACELNVSAVLAIDATETVFADIPAHPAVTYDSTISMTSDNTTRDLLEKLIKSSDLLESVEVADLYGDASNYKLTLRFTYRASDRTLKEEEAKKEFSKVEAFLQ